MTASALGASKEFHQAIDRALAGDQTLLHTFHLERLTLAGPQMTTNTHLVEERLVATGDGVTDLRTRRSIAEVSGEPIGEFHVQRPKEVVAHLLQILRQVDLNALPPFSIGPADTRMELTVTLGASKQRAVIGFSNPTQLAVLKPLLNEMDHLAMETRKRPLATLTLTIQAPPHVTKDQTALPVTLVFHNAGAQGCWLTHPSQLAASTQAEFSRLQYGLKPQFTPGVTPLPISIETAPLSFAERDAEEMFWIPSMGQISYRFTAPVRFEHAGTYLLRATYATYHGEDRVKDKIRLRGAAFSNEITLPVV